MEECISLFFHLFLPYLTFNAIHSSRVQNQEQNFRGAKTKTVGRIKTRGFWIARFLRKWRVGLLGPNWSSLRQMVKRNSSIGFCLHLWILKLSLLLNLTLYELQIVQVLMIQVNKLCTIYSLCKHYSNCNRNLHTYAWPKNYYIGPCTVSRPKWSVLSSACTVSWSIGFVLRLPLSKSN